MTKVKMISMKIIFLGKIYIFIPMYLWELKTLDKEMGMKLFRVIRDII